MNFLAFLVFVLMVGMGIARSPFSVPGLMFFVDLGTVKRGSVPGSVPGSVVKRGGRTVVLPESEVFPELEVLPELDALPEPMSPTPFPSPQMVPMPSQRSPLWISVTLLLTSPRS